MEVDTEPAPKVRLVRCPNCMLILPEPEDVLVYKCGGCDTTLLAKRRYNDARRRGVALHGTEAEQMNGADRVSEVQDSVGSSQRVSFSSSTECSLEQNTERGGDVPGDFSNERIGGRKRSNEDQNEARNCNIEQPGSSSELAHCAESNGMNSEVEDDDESSNLIRRAKPSADIIDRSDTISRLSNAEISVVEQSSAESSAVVIGNDLIVSDDRLARDSFSSGIVLYSSDIVVSSPDEQRDRLRWVSSNDENHDGSDSVFGKLNTENAEAIDENNSTLTYHRPADESDSSEALASSDERPEQQSNGCDHSVPNGASEGHLEGNDHNKHLAEAKPEVDVENHHESDSTSRSSNAGDAFFTRENNSAVVSSPEEQKQFQETSDDERPNNAFVANSEVSDNDQSLRVVEAKSAFEVSKFKSTENTAATTDDTSDMPGGKTVSSEVLVSSPDIRRKPRFGASSKHHFNRVRSQDTLDSAGFFSPSSELSIIDYTCKSPTTRSAHAYDGSVSSFDGIDDQVPDQQYVNPNKFSSKLPVYGKAETRHHMKNLSSVKRDNDELLDNTRYNLHDRNVTRFERDDLQSLARLYQRDYLAGYESGGTSSYRQDEFNNHSNEQEKIRLLRMVYELQDQLKRRSYMNKMGSYRVPSEASAKDKYVPSYYSREITDEDISRELNFRRYPEKHRQGNSWFNQYKYSGIPFSGESLNSRNCIDSSCSHCCQFSAQLLPPIRSRSRRFCTSHAGHSCCRSCPSSPQQFTDSEYPVAYRETKSDDQRHEEYNAKRRTMEKAHLAKRHLRPTAGAAPFVICYHCLKPLQLPADFLLFKRRFHQLKCGACSEVLKFSLQDRIHLVPYNPEAEAAAPMDRTIPSSCNSNDYPLAEPVSCSDDYGRSHRNSNSTDTDPVLFTPFRNVQANNVPGRSMLHDPPAGEGNRLVRKQVQSKKKNPAERFEPAESSSQRSRSGKILTEIKELALKSGSPLHQLMGYNSPSQVLRGSHNPSSSSTSSFYS